MMWKCAKFEFDSTRPVVMGILNVTPDSFSDGGQHNGFAEAVAYARQMIDEGAQIIDVGGESTRPGSAEVSVEEELARVLDVVRQLADLGLCVSIDTRHAEVARACVEAGAAIINDVTGFRDPAMVEVAKNCDAGLVVMHMLGEPATMQDDPHYDDVVAEVKEYLGRRCARAHLRRSRPWLRQNREPDHGAHAQLPRVQPLGLSHDGRRFAQKLHRLRVWHKRACTARRGVGARGPYGMRPYVILGLGSNVALVANPGEETEGKIANLEQAITGLCSIPDTQIIDISSYYESEPAYYEDQDTFVNAVVLARTGVPPKELLKYLHAIENSLGRTREIENGPRTLDLDIVDYQMYVGQTDELTLPHPRVCERDFVVKPLLELLPNHVLADGTPVVAEGAVYGKATKL